MGNLNGRLVHMHNNSQNLPFCDLRPQCTRSAPTVHPLAHRGELQRRGVQPGGCEYPHTHMTPPSMGNSRVLESPALLQGFGSNAKALCGGEPNYI